MSAPDLQSSSLHDSRLLVLLAVLFAGSGCAALIYEIVWYQLLEFLIGSTTVSLGVLLATFMGRLCIGSMAFPRIPRLRRYHPLSGFTSIEVGIALCGLLVWWGMPRKGRCQRFQRKTNFSVSAIHDRATSEKPTFRELGSYFALTIGQPGVYSLDSVGVF